MDKEEIKKRGRELFETEGRCCAEAVLEAYAEHKNIKSDFVPKVATGFCTGVAGTSGQCGAVSGAILSINLLTGRETPEDSRDTNYAMIKELKTSFEKSEGSLNCTHLLGCDVGTDEGQETFEKNKLKEKCFGYVEEALGILHDLSVKHSV